MGDLLSEVLAFDRRIRARGAQRVIELDEGVVVLHDELPNLYHLNAVLLDAPLPGGLDAAALMRLADQQLGHLNHRQLVLDDVAAAERLSEQFVTAGWNRQRVVYMRSEHEPDRRPPSGLAREIDRATARPLQLALLSEDAPGTGAVTEALARQLLAGQEAVRAGTRSKCFAAGDGGELESMCTLFLSERPGGIAVIEEVGTLTEHRGRGLARAVVTAALDAGRADRAHEIVVPADADDWPQLLYAKLGFEPFGRQVSFTLRDAGGR